MFRSRPNANASASKKQRLSEYLKSPISRKWRKVDELPANGSRTNSTVYRKSVGFGRHTFVKTFSRGQGYKNMCCKCHAKTVDKQLLYCRTCLKIENVVYMKGGIRTNPGARGLEEMGAVRLEGMIYKRCGQTRGYDFMRVKWKSNRVVELCNFKDCPKRRQRYSYFCAGHVKKGFQMPWDLPDRTIPSVRWTRRTDVDGKVIEGKMINLDDALAVLETDPGERLRIPRLLAGPYGVNRILVCDGKAVDYVSLSFITTILPKFAAEISQCNLVTN